MLSCGIPSAQQLCSVQRPPHGIDFHLHLSHPSHLRGEVPRLRDDVIGILLNLTQRLHHFRKLISTDRGAGTPQPVDVRVERGEAVVDGHPLGDMLGFRRMTRARATGFARHDWTRFTLLCVLSFLWLIIVKNSTNRHA